MARLWLTAPRADEDDIHESVARALDILLMPPTEWTTFPAGGYQLTPAAAARLYRIGLKAAWPDVLISHHGLYGIELKAKDGTLARTRIIRTRRGGARVVSGQAEMHARLRASGAHIAVCRSLDSVLRQLRDWNIPTRERTA